MKIICVVGARPNFIKIAPLMREMKKINRITPILVHTGQHYDEMMSDIFFRELDIPRPDIFLGIKNTTPIQQIAEILVKFEKVCLDEKPDLVLVVGDVNSTLAAALVAVRLGIKIAHVEAGLRSFDQEMPEEINRILVDHVSDYLFITEESALNNLVKEGISRKKIFLTGNCLIQSLIEYLDHKSDVTSRLNLKKGEYCVITLHRPSNVDDKERLGEVLDILESIAYKVVWPIHPRTNNNIEKFGFKKRLVKHLIMGPLGYQDMIHLLKDCRFVLTDSGGIQEEATYLGIPCLTLRPNTERPITIKIGTNRLVNSKKEVLEAMKKLDKKRRSMPKFWDNQSAKRIIKVLIKYAKRKK